MHQLSPVIAKEQTPERGGEVTVCRIPPNYSKRVPLICGVISGRIANTLPKYPYDCFLGHHLFNKTVYILSFFKRRARELNSPNHPPGDFVKPLIPPY